MTIICGKRQIFDSLPTVGDNLYSILEIKRGFNIKQFPLSFNGPKVDVSLIKDRLGRPIDINMRELIRYLNMVFVRTTASCFGHEYRNTNGPWVDFDSNHLSRMIRVILLSNLEHKMCMFPFGIRADEIRLRALPETSLDESRRFFKSIEFSLAKEAGPYS